MQKSLSNKFIFMVTLMEMFMTSAEVRDIRTFLGFMEKDSVSLLCNSTDICAMI